MAEVEGPQTIGKRNPFVVVSAETWNALASNQEPLGEWLIENTPRGQEPLAPALRSSKRSTPFADEDDR